ncbi:hypothetical protein [Novosphingobium sp. PY1]|uniref:hypothetical protein n=1 Tax=Novosphingobium sp. PY1 TaxID=1882221 RepID=UPI001A8D3874|nr:hypothetical protein [Novosphingobium sp. PY1]GFM27170.1 putative uncharacterized protein [Novosphingobium sp. PY1]
MTVPEYLLIIINKLEIMEEVEREQSGIVEFDDLSELDAALSKLDKQLAEGVPDNAHP